MNAEGVQGPLNQRSDFKEAKRTCKSLHHEYTATTGMETNLSLQSNKSDKGAILKILKNTHIDLMLLQDGDTILLPQRFRLHLRHHDGNQAATCGQRGTGTRGNLHPGVNSDFLSFQMSDFYFACWKFNLMAIDGRCKQHTVRAHVFLMLILSACLCNSCSGCSHIVTH